MQYISVVRLVQRKHFDDLTLMNEYAKKVLLFREPRSENPKGKRKLYTSECIEVLLLAADNSVNDRAKL